MSDQGTPADPFRPPDEGGSSGSGAGGADQPGSSGGQEGYQQQYGPPPYGQPPSGQPPQFGQQYGQPQYGYGQQAGGPAPANYLVWAILSTIFCCLPLGIASIVFAAQVNGKWAAGDVQGARDSSEKAKKFAIWSAAVSLILAVLGIALVAIGSASDSG